MKTRQQIAQEIFDQCKEKIPQISNFKSGSIFRLFIEVVASFLETLYQELEKISKNRYIQTAEDQFLNLKAEELGLNRIPASKTKGHIMVYRKDASNTITIDKDKIVATKPDSSGNIFRYKVLKSIVINKDIDKASILIEAESEGSNYNVPPNSITEMITPISGIDSINNEHTYWIVDAGKDIETDESLRNRCLSIWKGLSGTNQNSYIAWIKSSGHVGDIKIIPTPNNVVGRVDIICCGKDNTQPSMEIINQVQDIIDQNKPIATNVQVMAPIEIKLDLNIEVVYLPHVILDIDTMKQEIKEKVNEYFSTISIGHDVEPSAIIGYIYSIKNIKSVTIISPTDMYRITEKQIARLSNNLQITIKNSQEV